MNSAKSRNLLLLAAATVLPGCLAINAALGVFGALGPPVAQLAGAAYTVAEYSYEYGVNDRTPDQVFLAKFEWLTEDENDPNPAAFAGALSAAMSTPQVTDAPRVTLAEARPASGPEVRSAVIPAVEKTAVPPRVALPRRTAAPVKPVAQARPRPQSPAKHAPSAPSAPEIAPRTYVEHAPDPLLARLDRVENGLAQAEKLYLSDNADGLRLSVPPCDGDPCAQGVNGGNSLRLPVMRTVPAAPAASGERTAQSGQPSSRALNT